MSVHVTDLELETYRTEEADELVRNHVATCLSCQQRFQDLVAIAAELGRPVAPVTIPGEVERSILDHAQQRSAQIRARRRSRRLVAWAGSATAAAAASLALVVLPGFIEQKSRSVREREVMASDVNRDGRVNILDALGLALRIEQGMANPRWDLNDDGVIDRRDADHVAGIAVALDRGGSG